MKTLIKRLQFTVCRWIWPILFTLAILCVAGAVAFPQISNCVGEWLSWPTWAERMLSAAQPPTGCMKPNEIGDFLAGAFAPIAFVWLAFAVVLQSRELNAQAKVLRLTKDELKLTRQETGLQRIALEEQAKVMAETARLTTEQQARIDLDTLVEMVAPHIREVCKLVGFAHGLSPDPKELLRTKGPDFVKAVNVVIPLSNVEDSYKEADNHLRTLFIQYSTYIKVMPSRLGVYDEALYQAYHFPLILSALKRFGNSRRIVLNEPDLMKTTEG